METLAVKKSKGRIDVKQYGMVLALIAIYLLFFFLTGGTNASPTNINNLIMQNGYIIILSVGMLLCVLTGNIDLGVGSVVAVCGASAAIAVVDFHLPVFVGFLFALGIGGLFGVFTGFFVSVLSIPPFIVTLATMLIGRGFTYTILQAQTKGPLPPSYTKIGAGFLPSAKVSIFGNQLDLLCLIIALTASVLIILSTVHSNNTKRKYGFPIIPEWQELIKIGLILFLVWFLLIKLALYKGIPYVLLLMGVLVAFYHFLTEKTVAGRQIYALGGNAKAARLSGINTRKVYFWVYANMGLLCGVAGIVLSARNASATPKAGDGFEMDAISACYIGGAAIAGGSGTIIGAVVGALIMGILNNGMSLVGLSTDIQKIVKGMVLLGAVTVDLVSKQKKA
ncbi:ABC-type xylose transport system, permease component [Sphaerochaeta pleomorpha str. Grapes]|uniref:Xylose transport system permease protein XylH n=1 Tax=Sphaerochaeta pleomorpha (strain ATCC BAA-1885 / DSM 22778 / Grapes) TaxID=158190 RepID=G8QYG3_SPHPG|nr:multiple monosaccharide ABC transporter permease [Sphaerochaeta pleomorpha]AEV30810.1 ABC-type xylose transport system, permease component [Sphaerochaeta pleomorpha str. Grapes]